MCSRGAHIETPSGVFERPDDRRHHSAYRRFDSLFAGTLPCTEMFRIFEGRNPNDVE